MLSGYVLLAIGILGTLILLKVVRPRIKTKQNRRKVALATCGMAVLLGIGALTSYLASVDYNNMVEIAPVTREAAIRQMESDGPIVAAGQISNTTEVVSGDRVAVVQCADDCTETFPDELIVSSDAGDFVVPEGYERENWPFESRDGRTTHFLEHGQNVIVYGTYEGGDRIDGSIVYAGNTQSFGAWAQSGLMSTRISAALNAVAGVVILLLSLIAFFRKSPAEVSAAADSVVKAIDKAQGTDRPSSAKTNAVTDDVGASGDSSGG